MTDNYFLPISCLEFFDKLYSFIFMIYDETTNKINKLSLDKPIKYFISFI